jgi:hypothetical protein
VGGERIYGARPSRIAHTIFQFVLLMAVIGGIVAESIATPLYRRDFYEKHGLMRGSWFVIAESVFGPTLVVEFVIKIIADGFLNAYVRSIRTRLLHHGWDRRQCRDGSDLRRRSQPALRALKLITLIEKMRSMFESLIISGITRILDTAMLAML